MTTRRLFILILLVQTGCIAVGLVFHHLYISSGIARVQADESRARLTNQSADDGGSVLARAAGDEKVDPAEVLVIPTPARSTRPGRASPRPLRALDGAWRPPPRAGAGVAAVEQAGPEGDATLAGFPEAGADALRHVANHREVTQRNSSFRS